MLSNIYLAEEILCELLPLKITIGRNSSLADVGNDINQVNDQSLLNARSDVARVAASAVCIDV